MRKSKFKFRKILIIYTIILIALAGAFLVYVNKTLKQYELSNGKSYLANYFANITNKELSEFITTDLKINSLDTKDIDLSKELNRLSKDDMLEYRKNDNSTEKNLSYAIYNEGRKLFTVDLVATKEIQRLGLLKYYILEIDNITSTMDKGLYFYNISVPSTYKVSVNGTVLSKDNISKTDKISELSAMYDYVDIPSIVTYEVNNFINKPTIVINDGLNNKDFVTEGYNITVPISFESINTYDSAMEKVNGKIDILKLAEMWSLFMTNDLEGTSHGFSKLSPYLIKNSYMYNLANSWAHNIDITFVSVHSLVNKTFTNEKLSNFKIYNENAFSCEVYLEKNMIVNKKLKVDKMHDILYFVYYDDTNDKVDNPTWKLVGMQAIVDEASHEE